MPVAISASLDGSEPPGEVRRLAQVADAGGADTLWIACHLFRRDPVALAAAALTATPRLGVALMALSPYAVHPVYAAMAAATLDEMFPGRVQLCLGVGAPRDLAAAGIEAPRPVATLTEAIAIARALLAGETVAFAGERFRVEGRCLASGARPVPIALAASGPRMLELAGKAADSVLISSASAPEFVGWCLDHVRRGEAATERKVRRIGLVAAALDDGVQRGHARVRRNLAYVLRGAHHARNLALAGSALDQAALHGAYAREDWAAVDTLMTDDVVGRHAACGSVDEVSGRLARYHAAGLDEIVLAGVGDAAMLQRLLAVCRPNGP